ncbi:hypothetical protein XELAEV_18026837mg [Xenopus laevis]|uniref:GIY-YIG domain-containing protein n=1 Tax=Xenopus laevis TaxID=8355 RepID=A0A974CWZ4_XENLA|nr:hypothetical protein XELAEV_18026837mg [Xenopus laevis]
MRVKKLNLHAKIPCGLAYVGQTSRAVKERIKENRGNIRNFKIGTQSDTPVSRHFASHAIWIKKLNTMTQMGLNDYWSLSLFL